MSPHSNEMPSKTTDGTLLERWIKLLTLVVAAAGVMVTFSLGYIANQSSREARADRKAEYEAGQVAQKFQLKTAAIKNLTEAYNQYFADAISHHTDYWDHIVGLATTGILLEFGITTESKEGMSEQDKLGRANEKYIQSAVKFRSAVLECCLVFDLTPPDPHFLPDISIMQDATILAGKHTAMLESALRPGIKKSIDLAKKTGQLTKPDGQFEAMGKAAPLIYGDFLAYDKKVEAVYDRVFTLCWNDLKGNRQVPIQPTPTPSPASPSDSSFRSSLPPASPSPTSP